jgi:hypothetical protein
VVWPCNHPVSPEFRSPVVVATATANMLGDLDDPGKIHAWLRFEWVQGMYEV